MRQHARLTEADRATEDTVRPFHLGEDTQALIALARRRVNVLWAMLRDGTTFETRSAT
jgi:hypothetical protein